jgi:hypothetical protein
VAWQGAALFDRPQSHPQRTQSHRAGRATVGDCRGRRRGRATTPADLTARAWQEALENFGVAATFVRIGLTGNSSNKPACTKAELRRAVAWWPTSGRKGGASVQNSRSSQPHRARLSAPDPL